MADRHNAPSASKTDFDPTWWQWCTGCGNLWSVSESGGCKCEFDECQSFPDPQAIAAVRMVGGDAAVWAVERHLYFGWRKFRMGR